MVDKWDIDCGCFEYGPSFSPVIASSTTKSLEVSATQMLKDASKSFTKKSFQIFLHDLPIPWEYCNAIRVVSCSDAMKFKQQSSTDRKSPWKEGPNY